MILRRALSMASPAGDRARLSVMVFHRVWPHEDPLFPNEVDANRFDAICGWIKEWFNVLPLGEAIERLYSGNLPARALALTFDDGYVDNLTVAAPILRRHALPCTFFIATGYLDGGCMWNDVLIEAVRRTSSRELDTEEFPTIRRRLPMVTIDDRRRAVDSLVASAKYLPIEQRLDFVAAIARRAEVTPPQDLMLTSQQVRSMRDLGFEMGAHTVSHPILAQLSRTQARHEIEAGKTQLEKILGQPVALFAYPNGKPDKDYVAESVELAREAGFGAAVSTGWGVSTRATDRFQLARFTPWDRARVAFGARLLRNAFNVAGGVSG